ncbi:P-loop containing nucleoside triphosphate hydrolase protein [Flagelloscypha sp. PMI_526]|nr:P-loop containing nucleoside triphosphate hydrolase protein [Flagelloscypha sp. PMI_526]
MKRKGVEFDEPDIADVLVSKRPRFESDDGSEDELDDIINSSIVQRNVKQGTSVLKHAKGKAKIQKGEVGGGSFQSMGLHPSLLRSLTLQGFRIPTPIQRLAIPALLATPPRDLVGMARTGSGKSLAYLIPLVQRLGGRHSSTFGARGLILLPTRELALQILKVGKELSRGFQSEGTHAGDNKTDNKKGQTLRWGLVVGGESLDDQFDMISSNPDVIIATPGRLLHLAVEMNMDLKSVQYVVFDEADRLFEMGFETALTEILQRLPPARQTLLFSATLPKSLVEFAKAGLQDPKLVRLDAESKVSSDLRMAFFSVKQAEKEASLLSLLRDVIKVPLGEADGPTKSSKTKLGEVTTTPQQTLIFVATKHHVEYLSNILIAVGYSVAYIYGSLDQAARTFQMDQFRRGLKNILVVTDVAARGIDIPILENVVNYDFPQGARVFIHRVGRTARAGRQGWAWSFVTSTELPYLLDLQLFLGSPLVTEVPDDADSSFSQNLVLGTFERERIDEDVEFVRSLDDVNHSLPSLRQVMLRGQAMYERSKGKASPISYKRAKEMSKDPKWSYTGTQTILHPVLTRGVDATSKRRDVAARNSLLEAVNAFRPAETVLEAKGSKDNASLMKQRRKALDKSVERAQLAKTTVVAGESDEEEEERPVAGSSKLVEMANEEDIMAVFGVGGKKTYRDSDFFMSYEKAGTHEEKGYSLKDGASFAEQATGVSFDLAGDDGVADKKKRQLSWDKKKKKFIKGDGAGSDNVKMVKTENGVRLPASYRSGRFDEWKSKMRVSLPKVGEQEAGGAQTHWQQRGSGGKKFKHNKVTFAKPLDKFGKDYERKVRQMKKRDSEATSSGGLNEGSVSRQGKKGGRYGGKPIGRVRNELKNTAQIRKERQLLEKRRAKNARPSKNRKR